MARVRFYSHATLAELVGLVGLVERPAATAGAARIRVSHIKPFAGQPIIKMNLAPIQVFMTGRVY